MSDNPGEINFRYNVDQASIKNAIDAVNAINKAIDDGDVDLRTWNEDGNRVAQVLEQFTKGGNATEASIKNINIALVSMHTDLSALPSDLTAVANAFAILQNPIQIAIDKTKELEDSIDAQFAAQDKLDAAHDASKSPRLKDPGNVVDPAYYLGIEKMTQENAPKEQLDKYNLGNEQQEFKPAPHNTSDATDILANASEITGAYEGLDKVRDSFRDAYAALVRMQGGLKDLTPEWTNLSKAVLAFGDTDQKLPDVARAIDRIRTSTGELGAEAPASLRQAAMAVQDFVEKFNLINVPAKNDELGSSGFDVRNLPEVQAGLPRPDSTVVPGLPEDIDPHQLTSTLTPGYRDAIRAVKDFNEALIENKDTLNTQDPELRDVAGIFAILNEKIKDGTVSMVDLNDAITRFESTERDLSDAPDFYDKLINSIRKYELEQQNLLDKAVPLGGAGGAGGPLPTGENNGLPFAGAGEAGGLADEIKEIRQAWMDISKAEYDAVQTMDGITTKANEAAGTFAILVEDSDQYNAALEKMDEALMGGVDAWSAQEKAAAAAQAELQAIQEEAAGPAREAGLAFRDALGPIQTQIDLIKGLKSDYILLNDEAADYEEKLRAAEALHKEIQAVMISEGETHRGLIQISVSSEEEYQKELKAIQDEVAAWTAAAEAASRVPSSAGGAGGGKPPEPPKPPEPDYTIPPEYGGASFGKQSGVIRPNLGFGEDEIQARQAKEAVDEIIKSYKDLNSEQRGVNQSEASFTRMLADSNVQFASLLNKAEELGKAADIEEIIVQFAALTTNEEQAVRNATALEQTLKGLGTGHIAEAVELFNQLVDKEQQLISIQDQLNAKTLNLTVAGSGSNIPGAPDSAKVTDNTYNIAFDASARSAAEVQSNLAAIQQDLLAINPAADKTSFAFQNIAAASQEVRQIAAIDNLVKQFGDLYDPITQGNEALGQMVSQMQQIGASPEQIEQASQAFKDLQSSALQAAGAEAQNATIMKEIADAKNALSQQALSPTDADFGGDASGNLGQRAVPAEGLRRTGTAISQLGLGNKDIQQVGTDIRLIGDVQQVNKEIGLLATAFENLPGAMGEAARASSALATGIAGPVAGSFAALLTVVGPFAALLAVGAYAWQKLQEEMKGANDALNEANSAVKSYYTAIQEGTSTSIADKLQKAQDKKNIEDDVLKTQTDAMAHGFESAQNQFGDPLARLFFALGQSGLSGGDAMKKMQKEMDDATSKTVELAGTIDGLTRAENDAQVQKNQINADIIKSASDQMAIARQEATDSTMTGDAIRKRLADLQAERSLLESSNDTLSASKDKNSALNAEMAKNNDALDKNGLEIAKITDSLLPEIDARERETAAIKAQEEALDASAKKLIAGTDKLIADDVSRKKLEQTGTSAGVKNTVTDYQTEIDSIQQNLPRIKAALDLAKELDTNKGLKAPSKETQDLQAEFDKLSARLTDLKDKVSDYTSSLIPELQAKERQADITKELTSETDSYLKKQADEITLRQQDSEKMLSIEQDYSNKLISIAQKARDAAAQALQELKAKQTEDLQKLSDGTTDDQTKLAITKRDAQIKFGEQEVKDWTDHYNKLADLRQKAQDSEYDDEANRDFAALARDRRKLSTDINSENTNYTQKETQKQTQLADELKMDDLHAKDQAAQRLVEYERANRDAQQQYDQRLQAAKDAAQKEKDAADAARAQEIAAEVAHFNNLMSVREEKYQEELNLLRKHLQDEIDVINGTSVNTQGGNGYSYGPQNQGATQPYSNPNPGLQVYSPSMYQGGGTSTQLNTTVTGNTIALPNLQDLIGGVENAGLSLLQSFLSS